MRYTEKHCRLEHNYCLHTEGERETLETEIKIKNTLDDLKLKERVNNIKAPFIIRKWTYIYTYAERLHTARNFSGNSSRFGADWTRAWEAV